MSTECKKEYEKLIKELRLTTENILSDTREQINTALLSALKKTASVCAESFTSQMKETMGQLKSEASKNLDAVSKEIDRFMEDLRK
ncbi:hypothetical protein QE152_g35935 [Popillia japonica]|uniref:Uncharacterized protein n=1 Tax=Popillia japonica TaxID=7064 RepID=A0AAW1IES7_POPJA